jgi:hypothetical protein
MSAVSARAVRRTGASFSPPPSVCSGSQSTTVTGPCGEKSVVTGVTSASGTPTRRAKEECGSKEVADAPMKTGSAP